VRRVAARADRQHRPGQLRQRGADVPGRGRPALRQQIEHGPGGLVEPGGRIGDPGGPELVQQVAPLHGGDVEGGGVMGERGVPAAEHPQRAAHRVVAQQGALVVQRGRDRIERGGAHPRRCREVDGDRVGGVQRDQIVGDGDDVVGAGVRRQPVPEGQPGPALGIADVPDVLSDFHGHRCSRSPTVAAVDPRGRRGS